MKKPSLYNYETQLGSYQRRLTNEQGISKKNKEIITSYVRDSQLKGGIAIPTVLKYYDILVNVSLNLKKDLNKLTKEDFENIIERVNKRENISIATKQKYWAILKKFGNWLVNGDKIFNSNGFVHDYPEIVGWINTNIKSKDLHKIRASDILTEEEIDKLISSTQNTRDRAFLSVLYETGARISELGNIKIGDITEQENGYLIDLSAGKTGERTTIIVFSSSKLIAWLNQHPNKEDKNAPVWVVTNEGKKKKLNVGSKLLYRSLSKIVERAKKKANINKRIHPHIFRHSRVTHLLANKQINESQAKIYFGWCPSSKMLSQYSHLTSDDVNRTMLEINGIKSIENKTSGKKARLCPNCNKPNDPKDSFCGYCSRPLDFKAFIRVQEADKLTKEIGGEIMKAPNKSKEEIIEKYIDKLIEKKLKEKMEMIE